MTVDRNSISNLATNICKYNMQQKVHVTHKTRFTDHCDRRRKARSMF